MEQKALSYKELLELQASYTEAAKTNIQNHQTQLKQSREQKAKKSWLIASLDWLTN